MSKFNILLCITGSIAAFKASTLVSCLVKDGYKVRCTATECALKFIGKATLEGITKEPVLTDMFERGEEINHIKLPEWADLILLYPASGNTINKLHAGIADDLVSAVFLANNFRKPYWIAPAMNVHMFQHPSTQRSLKVLEEWGARILPTEDGVLACGEIGQGRLLSPEMLFQMIKDAK